MGALCSLVFLDHGTSWPCVVSVQVDQVDRLRGAGHEGPKGLSDERGAACLLDDTGL